MEITPTPSIQPAADDRFASLVTQASHGLFLAREHLLPIDVGPTPSMDDAAALVWDAAQRVGDALDQPAPPAAIEAARAGLAALDEASDFLSANTSTHEWIPEPRELREQAVQLVRTAGQHLFEASRAARLG